jgi:iron complex transport system substrate-binding protein
VDLDYVRSAAVNTVTIYDFENKSLMVDFNRPMMIVSTLEGVKNNILTVGNHYSPPPTWGPGHKNGIDHIQASILKANQKDAKTTSFLITGADMGNLSIVSRQFKEMKVVAFVTAGVMSNAVRMAKDVGHYYEPGTINMIIMTNMELSLRAMTRAIISATEAKTAALEDMDIRSSFTPKRHEATGTGTDNVLVVQGHGKAIKNAGGHTKMGELIAKAVYAAVNEAVLKQNKITARRHIFQRLKERRISVFSLISGVNCDCMDQNNISSGDLACKVEHLLLEKKYSGFVEMALAVCDEYEKGLIKDLSLYERTCRMVAADISGQPVDRIQDYLEGQDIPRVLKMALNALITGALNDLDRK